MLHSVLWSSGRYISQTKDPLSDLSLVPKDIDSDGLRREECEAVEDSRHRCVSDNWSGPHHWLDYLFFVPLSGPILQCNFPYHQCPI